MDIGREYRVLLMVGDDLGDFVSVKGKDRPARDQLVGSNVERWGREWIVLPNPSYGSWERTFYDPGKDDGEVILQKKTAELNCQLP